MSEKSAVENPNPAGMSAIACAVSNHEWIFALLLILITVAVFSQVVDSGFIWDDYVNIVQNPYIAGSFFSSLLRFWEKPYAYLYIPFTYSVWLVLTRVASLWNLVTGGVQLGAGPYHLLNLLLHILSVLVVFAILKKLTRTAWASCAGAVLFAVHPIQVEAVAWVTGLKDVLAGLLLLVAVWQYLAFAESAAALNPANKGAAKKSTASFKASSARKMRIHYAFALGAFGLALLSKPAAAILPLALWVLDRFLIGRSLRQATLSLAGWPLLVLPIAVATMAAQTVELVNFITPLWLRPVLMADALGFYLYKLVFPLWLGVDYGRSAEWFATEGWRQFVWLVPCGLAVLIWFGSKRRPWLFAATALFVIGILPVSGLLLFAFQNISVVADRYLYFSMLGPAVALAFFLSGRSDKPAIAVTVLVLSLWSLKSAAQVQIWRDENSLFSHALHLNPASWVSRNNLAYYLSRHGKLEDAVAQYKLVLQQKPEHVDAISNLGSIYARQGKLDDAIAQYKEALRIYPASAPAHTSLANILASRGEIDEAIRHYRAALQTDSEDFEAHRNLGNLLFNREQNEEAIKHFMSALQGNSVSADIYNNLAIALAKTGRVDAAIDYLRSALGVNPNDADTHNNLGIALAGTGQVEDGAEHFREAVRLRPDFFQAHENLSRALAVLGKLEEADKEHREAQRIEQLQKPKD